MTTATLCEDDRSAAPTAELNLLGGFRLNVDGREVGLSPGLQRVLALLALRGRTGRSRLAGTLWWDANEERAMARLRTHLWRLRQVAPVVVDPGTGAAALAEHVRVDVRDLREHCTAVLAGDDGTSAGPVDGRAVHVLLTGAAELLPDWDDPWLVDERERLHQLRLHVLEQVSAALSLRGRHGLALELALCALSVDPLRESAHRAVIRVHLAEGNAGEALRALDRCRDVLAEELGLTPSPQTAQLLAGVRRADVENRAVTRLVAAAP